MGGEVRKQPELRTRQAHRPGSGRAGGRRHPVVQLSRVVDERAHVRAELEHPLGLRENRAGRAGVAEREMGACRARARPGWSAREGRDRAAAAGGGRVSSAARASSCLALVECDASRRHMRERARRVVAEARLVDERLRSACALALPRPRLPVWPREVRAVPAPGRPLPRRRSPAPARRLPRGRPSHDRCAPSSACACAASEERGGDPVTSRWELCRAPVRRLRALARHRPASCGPAEWPPRARSWRCRPRAGSPRSRRRREPAAARHRRAVPSARATQAP